MSVFAALLSAVQIQAVPYYTARSQSVNAAREMVGWEEDINRCNEDHIYGSFSITPEYTQTFRSNRIASCIFGSDLSCSDDCGSSLKIQGSLVTGRDPNAWLADYFGLPEDFNSTVSFKPRISNFLVDLNFYLGLDELACGLYFRVHAPIVHTRWKLNPCESIVAAGTVGYQAGYFSSNPVAVSALSTSALDFFSGNAGGVRAPLLTNNNTTATGNSSLPANVIFQPLAASRWSDDCGDCHSNTKTRLSDVEFALGWNFWCNEDYLVGLQLRASAPTGNKPSSCYLMEPVVGSGGFWKLGGGLDFHAIFWRSECESSSFGFYLDANIQHLFDTCQKRTFDLRTSGTACVAGQNSRYMLAQRLQPVDATVATNPFPLAPANTLGLQFASEFAPVANITTFNVDVKVNVEADIAAKFAYTNGCFGFDLGYEFYGRSCEKFCPKTDCVGNALDGQTWALKGDSQVFGFNTVTTTAPVALAATQSGATIHGGVNNFATAATVRQNSALIDSPVFATNSTVSSTVATAQRSSSTPVGLTIANVNFEGTRAISNKLFAHFNYSWRDNEDWTPYLGLGGEVEFAGCGSCGSSCGSCGNSCGSCGNSCGNTCATSCATSCASSCGSTSGDCTRCVPNQWGVWVKGGVSFN